MIQHWQKILRTHWGRTAELRQLGGEYDLNFLATCNDGETALMKVMRKGCSTELVALQIAATQHVTSRNAKIPLPSVIPTESGQMLATIPDETGTDRLCWLIEGVEGVNYAEYSPKSAHLITELGAHIGNLDHALADFNHPILDRDFKWNLTAADWITDQLAKITSPERKEILQDICDEFLTIKTKLSALDYQAIHNDINDYNVLVHLDDDNQSHISGLIDLGDMCRAPRVCEVAIAGAYIVLDHPYPERELCALVSGYHRTNPLSERELALIWPLLRMRLAVSVVNSTLEAKDNPDDPYVTISQAPAWRFLERCNLSAGIVQKRLRLACGYPIAQNADHVISWVDKHRGQFHPVLGKDLADFPVQPLSPEHSTCPENPLLITNEEAANLCPQLSNTCWLGYWKEPRLIYSSDDFKNGPYTAGDRRTVHLGVDIFDSVNSDVYAPLDGTVHVLENRSERLDYGGVIVLRHETDAGDPFYTLYGHLNPEVCNRLKIGDHVRKGQAFCQLGGPDENGGWQPHLHFQWAPCIDGIDEVWPGVADPDDLDFWAAQFPNPAPLLNLNDVKVEADVIDKKKIHSHRKERFSGNLSLSYSDPVMPVRGWRHHLIDEWGRRYLDAYNNVPHVGHAHPRIRRVAIDQLGRMNSNTRYLHPALIRFADKLLEKLPSQFSKCFFVNSGSEANELALRLARAATGEKGIVTPDHGYHGNTTGAMDISAYKFNARGGQGKPDWVELVEVADDYRGSFARHDPDRAEKFASLVPDAINNLRARNIGLSGFIAETFPSVGGQIIPPPGYLHKVYEHIRNAGGICIADEVQTGLGRLGQFYFGFEHQQAQPDVVVLGKPIGNGHPIGVVITTDDIAEKFAKGPEFFSTFGGSNLSARIGAEVLQIVDDEGLMENARIMGDRLIAGLTQLQDKHPVIGDIRGMGLFLGVDLVTDRVTKTPATQIASYVKNRLRERRILVGTEGPFDNILKIRPPLTIEADDVDMLLEVLDDILSETPVRQIR